MHNETSGLLFNYYLVYFSIIIYSKTDKKALSFDDGYALFSAKTADRGQLAAKYLMNEMTSLLNHHPTETQNRGMKV